MGNIMAKHHSADVRDIVLCGHSGSGKTIFAEAMLLKTRMITRLGSIADGSTVSDFEKEEKEYQYSLNPSIMHFPYAGKEFNLVDVSGQVDFQGGMVGGMVGGDVAVVCVNAMRGIELMTRKAWDLAGQYGLGRIVVIARMDGENVNSQEVLSALRKNFGPKCVPFVVADGEGAS
ncbi:MAG: elongation factor G, partial [Planctomycetota bacterium]|nr:elongation factor G [Planctomycetota bacterium]